MWSDGVYRRLKIVVIAAVLALSSVTAGASPWPRGANHVFLSSSANYFRAEGDFLGSTPGEEDDLFERYETDTYLEFGLSDRYTIGGKVVYGTTTVGNRFETISDSGFSEIEGFLQRQLWGGGKGVGAVSLTFASPSRFDAGVRQSVQSDGPALEARFLYGRDFIEKPIKIYAAAEAGYRRQFEDAADQARTQLTLGIEPIPRFLLLLQSFNTISIRNETNGGADFDVYKAAPSLVWRGGKRWSLQAGATFEYAGRNLARGTTYSIGVWTAF